MDNQLSNTPHVSPFEAIRREGEDGSEYWSARELYKLLGYSSWQRFQHAIEQAKKACQESGQAISAHFNADVKIVKAGATTKPRDDYKLSRYACYLIVLAGDESKPVVALGKVYFAVQTRRQELADQLAELPEDQQRLVRREQMSVLNTQLAEAAQRAGVVTPPDFAIFQDHGYRGLYGGESARAVKARKSLPKNEDILDWMNSDELAANAFRASLARQKIDREQIQGKDQANQAHAQMGKLVRDTIKEAGATLPEDMPTPEKSIQQLQREEQLRIERQRQPSLFESLESPEE